MAVTNTTVPEYVRSVHEVDERAFNVFFREHFRMVSLFAFRITHRMDVSEEIAADSFWKLWERRAGFTHPLAMKAFVFTAVRFACLNFLRERVRERNGINRFARFCEKQERFVLQDLINTEVCREAMGAVRSLPSQCRRVIESLFLAGCTPAEVAADMKLTVSTVRNQKARGFSLIRKKMERTGNFPVDHEFIFDEI
ncbi:MAG: sigma-70 family RNA polymerase sigma factor [Chitinophagaceae bacterium]|nr:MAG: sigma-70 family RNA polymerase sigma factor [Chitinophagaceae bacterium]